MILYDDIISCLCCLHRMAFESKYSLNTDLKRCVNFRYWFPCVCTCISLLKKCGMNNYYISAFTWHMYFVFTDNGSLRIYCRNCGTAMFPDTSVYPGSNTGSILDNSCTEASRKDAVKAAPCWFNLLKL